MNISKRKKLYFVLILKNREAWYKKLIELKFNQDEAIEYANLFVDNDVEISMIRELNDDILKGVGIEKVGQ
jgi:DNA-directed RNA polymerase subunit F